MVNYQPSYIIGFHSCDREVGLKILNGQDNFLLSNNNWDWLGPGVYFWEQDAQRALRYAKENAAGTQKNFKPAKIPFVLGAIVDLGNCLNLVEAASMRIFSEAHRELNKLMTQLGLKLPENNGHNRHLDCTVIKYIHLSNISNKCAPYDSIRCAFPEGNEAYPGSMISSLLHIQLCICNPNCIKGIFLPRPLHSFNPYLDGILKKN